MTATVDLLEEELKALQQGPQRKALYLGHFPSCLLLPSSHSAGCAVILIFTCQPTPTETKKVANNSQISSPLLHAQELENIFFLRETYPVLQVPNELKIIFSPQSCGPQETKYSGREGERQRETRHES